MPAGTKRPDEEKEDVAVSPPAAKKRKQDGSSQAKKLKQLADFSDTSPFPDYPAPTPQDAADVHYVLAHAHPNHASARKAPVDSATANSAATCGAVRDALDALIGTILSQNTSGRNSTAAKRSLDQTFGRHGFKAIAEAPREAVVDAIRMGGLANRKAEVIQGMLRAVHSKHGTYSLQHLSSLPDTEAMAELCSYDGIGPKTASCVLLFALGRDSFAVDTHVYRLSKLLHWVPQSADRVRTQLHLDVRIPGHLKYGLHVLMVAHGKACKGCKGDGNRTASCVLKKYMRERKGISEDNTTHVAEEAEKVEADEGTV
ncbi:DNA glycosylase [Peniophora sp. CONT]|nr:DNA glycosylase [Peniophora sp. CONT]